MPGLKDSLRAHLPASLHSLLRRLYYRHRLLRRVVHLPEELRDSLRRPGELRPPRWLAVIGDGDFVAIGQAFLGHFKELCQLRPDEAVLEVGCGIGRMALPLTTFIAGRGRYVGMDIVPDGIEWCRRHITVRFPNFEFLLADVFNEQYNPSGRCPAADYRFPFADASFDFAFLTSVFTHMLPADLAHYLREVSRVLRPGGRCLITYFLLNDQARALLSGRDHPFRHAFLDCLVTDPKVPEASIAYPEDRIRALYDTCGLSIPAPLHSGTWCGRATGLSAQDIVVAVKS